MAEPIDWNGKLHVVNGSPLSAPYPRDRVFYIVTDEAEAHEVAYSEEHKLWTGCEVYARVDGESGHWEPDDIAGWTDSYEDAVEAAELLAKQEPIAPDVLAALQSEAAK